jgi:hypothetical protein
MVARVITWFKTHSWSKLVLSGLWAFVLIGLPLTSFPLITRLTGATVAPFSAIPLALLALVWFLPYLLRRGSLPNESILLIFFILFVLALAAYSFFEEVGIFRDRSMLSQFVRTMIPFGTGVAFFLITSAWSKDSVSLRRSLQFIHIGGALLLLWAIAQAIVILSKSQFPAIMESIRSALVTQSKMEGTTRIGGLTWEASWFAHQLNMLYLPLWLAATYQRTTVFPKLWKISVENIFLVIGIGVFFLASPRIGAAAFMLMMLYIFLRFNVAVYHWIIQRLSHLWSSFQYPRLLKLGAGLLVIIAFISIYTLFSMGAFKIASERDPRVKMLVDSPLSQEEIKKLSAFDENTLFYLGLRFAFMERTVFWMTGWDIFNEHPWVGVGLGNSGYYFFSHMPAIGWSSIEMRAVMYQNEGLPNIKSIWYRLLAETGIVGFAIFITWLLMIWFSTSSSLHSRDDTIKTVALAGQLALLAYVFEGFSVDTFGLPYLFVITGLAASAGWIYRHKQEA